MKPLDEPTHKAAATALNRARVHGVAPITALHTAGLILSDDLARRIRADVLESVVTVLKSSRLQDLMPDGDHYKRNGAPPSAVRDAIVAQIEELADQARKGWFR